MTTSPHDLLWERAKKSIPGGVHSPVRAFKSVGGTPVFMEHGDGSFIYDIEGKKYLDFCMSWGALILGHQHPDVKEEVIKAINRGWTYGTVEPYSLALAEWMTREIPFLDQVRFVCSGTEAVLSALRLARGFTKRPKVLKFEGCYHGCVDSLLVQAGSGLAEASEPTSLGIPPGTAADTIVCPLNDETMFISLMERFGSSIAAVIIEPLPANNGLLVQTPSFLKTLREQTQKSGSLLIFDEVISGFRVSLGGMAELTKITPDLVTYGKVMGGGMPIGAYGGRRDIMSFLAPEGGVYQAGTLAGNPVGCVAGRTTLEILKQRKIHAHLETLGIRMEEKLKKPLEGKGVRFVRRGSIFWMVHAKEDIRNINDIPSNLKTTYKELFHQCLSKNIYLAPSGYEVGFLNASMTTENIDSACSTILSSMHA